MNRQHLEFCSSDEWAVLIGQHIIPWVLEGESLGSRAIEIGPGPGRTTEILRTMVEKLTAVEIDVDLAAALGVRLTDVEVLQADATELPFEAGAFDAALSFTMLHHVPTVEEQDRLFAEVLRVLAPGALFAGTDSLDSPEFRAMHIDDICNPIPPGALFHRLEQAGFTRVQIGTNPYALRFHARKPA